MTKRISMTVMTAALLITSMTAGLAQERKRIAILEIRANNTSNAYAEVVRDMLEVQLYKTNSFDLIERNQIDLILKEQGFSESACSDTDCAVKIGKLLSVHYVIVGSVSLVGKFTITLKFVDVSKGRLIHADSEAAQIEDNIEDAINKLAKRAANSLTGIQAEPVPDSKKTVDKDSVNKEPVAGSRPGVSYFNAFVPGLYQLRTGSTVRGALYMGGFAAAGGLFGYFALDFTSKRKAYNDLGPGDSQSLYNKKYDESRKALTRVNIALGIAAGMYLVNWADVLFFSNGDNSAGTVTASRHDGLPVENRYFSFDVRTDDVIINNDVRFTGGYSLRF